MKVAVTGANGFVGKELIRELLLQGFEVIAIVRTKESLDAIKSDQLRIVECSFDEYDLLASKIGVNENIDVFYHLAWIGTSGEQRGNTEIQMKNVLATKIAVEQAKRCGCKRFVYAGSIMEYEAMGYLPKDNTKPGKGYVYSTAKLSADWIAKIISENLGMKYINTIISNIYGEGEKSARFLNTIVRQMKNNESIELTEGKQLYDFIYRSDAVKLMVMAGCYGNNATFYYIGNKEQKPLCEYVKTAKKVLKSDSQLLFGAIAFQGPFLSYQEFDTNNIYKEFEYVPKVTFKMGVDLLGRTEDEISNFSRRSQKCD